MIREEIMEIAFRLFETQNQAEDVAKLFNSDLSLVDIYESKNTGFVFVLDGDIYDSEGNMSRYMKDCDSFKLLDEFFLKT